MYLGQHVREIISKTIILFRSKNSQGISFNILNIINFQTHPKPTGTFSFKFNNPLEEPLNNEPHLRP